MAEHATGAQSRAIDAIDACQTALEGILGAYMRLFDVQRECECAGRSFSAYAEYHEYDEQYVLVKRAKLWEAHIHEYAYFQIVDRLDGRALDELLGFMKTDALGRLDPEPDHMTSYLSLVIVTNSMDDQLARTVRKTRFRKDFRLGIRGWAELKLAVVDVSRQRVITNPAGESMEDPLKAGLARAGAL